MELSNSWRSKLRRTNLAKYFSSSSSLSFFFFSFSFLIFLPLWFGGYFFLIVIFLINNHFIFRLNSFLSDRLLSIYLLFLVRSSFQFFLYSINISYFSALFS